MTTFEYTGSRSDNRVLSVLHEAAWLVKDASFAANKKALAAATVEANIKRAPVENPSMVTTDTGEQPPRAGLVVQDSSVTTSALMTGLPVAAGDGVTPTLDAQGVMLASCMGAAPRLVTGDTVKTATVATTTTVEVTTVAGFQVGDVAGFLVSGRVYWRRIASIDGDELTLAHALPAAPAAESVVYGSITHWLVNGAAYAFQGDILGGRGAASSHNYEVFGAVGTLSMPETAVGAAQLINYTHKIAAATFDVDTVQGSPDHTLPGIGAGGEFLLSRFGESDAINLELLQVGLELGREYEWLPYAPGDAGAGGWMPLRAKPRITVHVRDDQPLPSGFVTATTYHEAWRVGGADNRWSGQFNWGGRYAGDAWGFGATCMHLVDEPTESNVGTIAAKKLTFGLTQGFGGLNKLFMFQG